MRHLNPMTRPGKAQSINDLLQGIALINAILGLYTAIANTFGLNIPQKNEPDEPVE